MHHRLDVAAAPLVAAGWTTSPHDFEASAQFGDCALFEVERGGVTLLLEYYDDDCLVVWPLEPSGKADDDEPSELICRDLRPDGRAMPRRVRRPGMARPAVTACGLLAPAVQEVGERPVPLVQRRPAPANEGGGRRRVPAVVVHQPRPQHQPGTAGAAVAVDHRLAAVRLEGVDRGDDVANDRAELEVVVAGPVDEVHLPPHRVV